MSDKELIQQRIDELETNIASGKSSGKTYRLVNQIIDNLFSFPIGSQIALVDHDNSENSRFSLKEMFTSRMAHDFPDTNFKIVYPAPGVVYVVRTTPTYQELAKDKLNKWKEKLKEMN